jgi:hypothetical protein
VVSELAISLVVLSRPDLIRSFWQLGTPILIEPQGVVTMQLSFPKRALSRDTEADQISTRCWIAELSAGR